MLQAAGRFLAPAVALTALALSPALGYANTFVLLGLGALAVLVWRIAEPGAGTAPATAFGGPPLPSSTEEDQARVAPLTDGTGSSPVTTGEGGQRSWWRGRSRAEGLTALLFTLAFGLVVLSALGAMREPADLLAVIPYVAPLFFLPLARLFGSRDLDLPRLALLGAAVGLAAAVALRLGLPDKPRAGEGSFITDPYRLAVTTLVCATLALGDLFTRARWRWLSLLGLVAAAATIWLTGSRTTLLGVPVLLFLTALCFVKRPVTIIGLVAGAVALAGAALFIELPGKVRMRLWDVAGSIARGETVGDESISVRIKLWGDGLRDFLDAPLFGHGWGEWMMAPMRARFPADLESLHTIQHMHNDLLHYAMAGGVPGLAAWALLLAAPVAGYFTLPREARSRQRLQAVLVLSLGYLVLGLPDVMLASPAQLTLYVALTAVVLGSGQFNRAIGSGQ